MVLTRYQQANLDSYSPPTQNKKRKAPPVPLDSTDKVLVTDPPLLTISHSRQTLDDDTLRIDSLVDQLNDYECSTLDAFMARWPSIHARLKGMKPHLPPKKDDAKPTLVLDLDETLLHTYRDTSNDGYVDYAVYAKDDYSCLLAGRLRPGVVEFLTWAASLFEVVVWTAGCRDYASMAIGCLDPENQLITHMLTRESCIRMRSASTKEVLYIKDLCALGRDLSKTFLVDNTPHAASLNLSNLIPIEAYEGSTSDTELLQLRRFLESSLVRLTDRRNDLRIILHRQLDLKRRIRQRVGHWKEQQHQQQQQKT
ncbi:HAD-like domain-containing protein [Blakeslea trispora]|nr:HAD-like domain-containing protein [Blakeslea trispora]